MELLATGIESLTLDHIDHFRRDPRMVAAGRSYFLRALEALPDTTRHLLGKEFAIATAKYAEATRLPDEADVVSPERCQRLVLMARTATDRRVLAIHLTEPELYEVLTHRMATSRKSLQR